LTIKFPVALYGVKGVWGESGILGLGPWYPGYVVESFGS